LRNRSTAARNSAGFSSQGKWPQSAMISIFAPGIRPAVSVAERRGIGSSRPWMKKAGRLACGNAPFERPLLEVSHDRGVRVGCAPGSHALGQLQRACRVDEEERPRDRPALEEFLFGHFSAPPALLDLLGPRVLFGPPLPVQDLSVLLEDVECAHRIDAHDPFEPLRMADE